MYFASPATPRTEVSVLPVVLRKDTWAAPVHAGGGVGAGAAAGAASWAIEGTAHKRHSAAAGIRYEWFTWGYLSLS